MMKIALEIVDPEEIDLMDTCYAVRQENDENDNEIIIFGAYEEGELLSTLNEEYMSELIPDGLMDFINAPFNVVETENEDITVFVEENIANLLGSFYEEDDDYYDDLDESFETDLDDYDEDFVEMFGFVPDKDLEDDDI